MRDLDEAEIEAALVETDYLHRLGGLSTGPPAAPAPPYMPPGMQLLLQPQAPPPPSLSQPLPLDDVLNLDGTNKVTLGGRMFELTTSEMAKVMKVVEKGYARAMRGELARVRENILGAKTMRAVPKESSATNPQDLRGMSRPGPVEITYRDAPPDRDVSIMRKTLPAAQEVSLVSSAQTAGSIATPDPRPRAPRRTAKTGVRRRKSVRSDWSESTPVAEGGGSPTGGSS